MSKFARVGACILKVAFICLTMDYIEKIRGNNGKIRSVGENEFIPRINLLGQKIGRLTVDSFAYKKKRNYYYNCICECGNECIKKSDYLLGKKNPHKSCGCWHRELNIISSTKHGMTNTPEHKSWQELIFRCNNPNCKAYKDYGGRGIKVCDRWLGENGFINFINDMGKKPSLKHSIDRINVNGNYCPENCRWATMKEQCNNRRSNIKIAYRGETKTLMQWCEIYQMKYSQALQAYYRGHELGYIIQRYSNK